MYEVSSKESDAIRATYYIVKYALCFFPCIEVRCFKQYS